MLQSSTQYMPSDVPLHAFNGMKESQNPGISALAGAPSVMAAATNGEGLGDGEAVVLGEAEGLIATGGVADGEVEGEGETDADGEGEEDAAVDDSSYGSLAAAQTEPPTATSAPS